MSARGEARQSGSAGGAGDVGAIAHVSTSVRRALAVGLLILGLADLAAADLVLLPHYLAGARRLSSPARVPTAVPPTTAPTALAPAVSPPLEHPTVVELPSRPAPAQAAPAHLAGVEFPHILFAKNTSWLSPVARETLTQAAATLIADPSRQVVINGHTDNSGPEELNRALSLDRAQRCGQWLEGHGVDPARMEIQGFGSTRPVGGDRSPEAQAHNRRVEIDLR